MHRRKNARLRAVSAEEASVACAFEDCQNPRAGKLAPHIPPTGTFRQSGAFRTNSSGSLTPEARDLLDAAVRARRSILITGGTGSGKTTLLNALSTYIGREERVVTIEDAAELALSQPHVVRLETRPASVEGRGEVTIRDLLRNALRMRPDRIVIGEVRGAEALDLLTALNTGHDGALSTLHANSPEDSLRRLETLSLMAGVGLPHDAIREQVARGIEIVVHVARGGDGSRRVVEIAEVVRTAAGIGVREVWRRGPGAVQAASRASAAED